jgi:hypothetical protein
MGESNCKSEDMRKVREAIVHWQDWEPPLASCEKANRGLSHIQCAYYLSPPELDWEDEEYVDKIWFPTTSLHFCSTRTQFVSFGNPPVNETSSWGRFLWPKDKYNPARPSDELLRGELLVKVSTVTQTKQRPYVLTVLSFIHRQIRLHGPYSSHQLQQSLHRPLELLEREEVSVVVQLD